MSRPLSPCVSCIELDKSFRLTCQRRPIAVGLSGRKAFEMQRGKSRDLKGLSSRKPAHVSMRMHPFPCESISEAGVHYQHNGPRRCVFLPHRLSALEDHSRRPGSEGGRGGVTGQGRVVGGWRSRSLDHAGSFQPFIYIITSLKCHDQSL